MNDHLNLAEILTKPNSADLVKDLLKIEKEQKKEKIKYDFSQLIGTWQLYFITGTKKVRNRGGIILGAGKYIPKFTRITLSYHPNSTVENQVKLGMLELILTGPIKFISETNILAFDFTKIRIKLFNKTIYSGYIRNGETKEKTFNQESLKKQAFFNYFLIQTDVIAARGRGGGLAIWIKDKQGYS